MGRGGNAGTRRCGYLRHRVKHAVSGVRSAHPTRPWKLCASSFANSIRQLSRRFFVFEKPHETSNERRAAGNGSNCASSAAAPMLWISISREGRFGNLASFTTRYNCRIISRGPFAEGSEEFLVHLRKLQNTSCVRLVRLPMLRVSMTRQGARRLLVEAQAAGGRAAFSACWPALVICPFLLH